MTHQELDQLSINTIRTLSIDAVQQAVCPRSSGGGGERGPGRLESCTAQISAGARNGEPRTVNREQ